MKQIVFTKPFTAELLELPEREPAAHEVQVATAFSTVSCGTERANFTGDPNVNAGGEPSVIFPRYVGYSSSGTVIKVGAAVKSVRPGDRVAMFVSLHKSVNTLPEANVIRLPEAVGLREASMCYIGTFPLAAVRKTRVELGESALVMGLGILGLLAVQFLRAAGAAPIIAADPVKERRELALALGADTAVDPLSPDFADTVKKLTGGGANVCIEVTGNGAALDSALDCMARFGRVALLGCTRDKNFTIDYYRKVHFPGVQLIGAHTVARPAVESHPGCFTHRDDIASILRLQEGGRLKLSSMPAEIASPADCQAVFTRLSSDPHFGPVIQFDWSLLPGEEA